MALDLAELGITQEELTERVVQRIADSVMRTGSVDDDDHYHGRHSEFAKELQKQSRERIATAVTEIADRTVLPHVSQIIEGLILEETNKWGEKTGRPMTFVEYLTKRAEDYLSEKVDSNGRSKAECGSYHSFGGGIETRLIHEVHGHIHQYIDQAMKAVIAEGNKMLVGGLEETCKAKLAEIAKALKVTVQTK